VLPRRSKQQQQRQWARSKRAPGQQAAAVCVQLLLLSLALRARCVLQQLGVLQR
jgi:hypothetical protein